MKHILEAAEFREKRKMRRIIASPLTFILIAAAAVVIGLQTFDMYRKWKTSEEALERTREAYVALEERAEFLEGRIEILSTEAGVEAEMRERFGVAKEGESVIVILDEEEGSDQLESDAGWWAGVKAWFSGGE